MGGLWHPRRSPRATHFPSCIPSSLPSPFLPPVHRPGVSRTVPIRLQSWPVSPRVILSPFSPSSYVHLVPQDCHHSQSHAPHRVAMGPLTSSALAALTPLRDAVDCMQFRCRCPLLYRSLFPFQLLYYFRFRSSLLLVHRALCSPFVPRASNLRPLSIYLLYPSPPFVPRSPTSIRLHLDSMYSDSLS